MFPLRYKARKQTTFIPLPHVLKLPPQSASVFEWSKFVIYVVTYYSQQHFEGTLKK